MVLHMTDAEYIKKLEGIERKLRQDKTALRKTCKLVLKNLEGHNILGNTELCKQLATAITATEGE